jgi:hypothetical protein
MEPEVPEPNPASTPEDQKRALLEAAQAAVEDARSRAERDGSRPRGPRYFSLILAAAAIGLGFYMLAARPAWFLTPPPPPEPPALQQASARLAIAREASLIEQYRAEHGRLPATLAEAGSSAVGVLYQPIGNAYQLRWSLGSDTITFSSTDSLPAFLGASLETVMSREGRQP